MGGADAGDDDILGGGSVVGGGDAGYVVKVVFVGVNDVDCGSFGPDLFHCV